MDTLQIVRNYRIGWHHADWCKHTGEHAALMRFNGATDEQVKARVERDYPDDMDYSTYLAASRASYQALWSRLKRHHNKGWLARLGLDDDLMFCQAHRLQHVPDAGWNWVKELRGVA